MKWFSIFVSLGLTLWCSWNLYNTQLKGVSSLRTKSSPQQEIIDGYQNAMQLNQKQLHAVMEENGETLSDSNTREVASFSNQKKSSVEISKHQIAPGKRIARPELAIPGRHLLPLRESDLQKFKGKWHYRGQSSSAPVNESVLMEINDDGKFSRLNIQLAQGEPVRFGTNRLPLRRDSTHGEYLFVTSGEVYMVLKPHGNRNLRGTLFRHISASPTYEKVRDFILTGK